jgi:hypothetical protein
MHLLAKCSKSAEPKIPNSFLRHWTDMGMIFSGCPALEELKNV